jgi:hypothetical protein
MPNDVRSGITRASWLIVAVVVIVVVVASVGGYFVLGRATNVTETTTWSTVTGSPSTLQAMFQQNLSIHSFPSLFGNLSSLGVDLVLKAGNGSTLAEYESVYRVSGEQVVNSTSFSVVDMSYSLMCLPSFCHSYHNVSSVWIARITNSVGFQWENLQTGGKNVTYGAAEELDGLLEPYALVFAPRYIYPLYPSLGDPRNDTATLVAKGQTSYDGLTMSVAKYNVTGDVGFSLIQLEIGTLPGTNLGLMVGTQATSVQGPSWYFHVANLTSA